MGLLVACKSHSLVSEQLVANHVAQRVVLRLDEEGRGVLAARIIYTLDEIARLGLSRSSSLVSTTGSSCHLLVASGHGTLCEHFCVVGDGVEGKK